jgi:hypothetical protein
MKKETVALGMFEVTSGALMVSDPCYELGTWCQGKLENVKNGTWNALSVRVEVPAFWDSGTEIRCGELIAYHSNIDYPMIELEGKWELTGIDVGVDSGQAGVFCSSVYRKDETVTTPLWRYGRDNLRECDKWYSSCCYQTSETRHHAGVINGGAVSISGYGDGGYDCYVVKDDIGQVVAVRIVFIGDEEDSEDE